MIDVLIVAHFFEIGHLQDLTNRFLYGACIALEKRQYLVFTKGSPGPVQFKQHNVPGLLEQTTLAIERAARIVPASSGMWFSIAILFRAKRQVLEDVGGGDQVSSMLLRLSSIGPFASAWTKATRDVKPGRLDGIFPSSPNWALQHTECACTACTNGVWRRDLVERTAAEVAGGAVQRCALVNPFDGYKTVFCDYCRRHCGYPWGRGNKPCVPHQ